MTLQQRIAIEDQSQVGEARRFAATSSRLVGLSEVDAGRVAIIVNELGTNLLKHAGGGEVLVRPISYGGRGVEVLSIDRGGGMDLAVAMRDGHSTAGTRGEGLGAVRRAAQEFDAWSGRGGTVIVARVWAGGNRPADTIAIGAVCQPLASESECGDNWDFRTTRSTVRVMVADGLGHGPIAARAANTAIGAFGGTDRLPGPEAIVHALHAALRSTRGAAVAVVELDLISRVVRFSGVGNIAAILEVGGHKAKGLLSNNGIAGHEARRIQEFSAEWPAHGALIVHSDGLQTHWKLEGYPGLQARHPSVIAGVLYRDFRRKGDDATVIVIKEP